LILDEIIEHKRHEVSESKKKHPLAELQRRVVARKSGRFADAIGASDRLSLIAEVKKASPSRGVLCSNFNPPALARLYAEGGASAVSVLTDSRYFQGDISHMVQAKEASGLPVLRKDFIIDEYQVWESAAVGADAILLIVAGLAAGQLSDYLQMASEIGLDALVEIHDREQLDTALRAGARIIGINNRDLRVFKTDIRTTVELASGIPDGYILVSESGIHTGEDVRMLREAGADAILVGESLVTSDDIPAKIRELIGGQS